MNPQLNQAINAFILNEFKLEPKVLDPDFDFTDDLGLTPEQLNNFLQRLQEALSITIPEDKILQIITLGDLCSALSSDDETLA